MKGIPHGGCNWEGCQICFPKKLRTKWDILQERREEAKKELERREAEIRHLATPFGDGQLGCSRCGKKLPTEEDFAKHFLVPDERYLNLGYCPTDERVANG